MSDAIHEIVGNDGNVTKIYYDTDCNNPRNDENLFNMVFFHKNKSIGDNHDFDCPEDYETFEKENKDIVSLPVYAYQHGGISLSLSPFSCPWDSGKIGYIYITKDKISENNIDLANLLKYASSELEVYSQWLNGEVYGYKIFSGSGEELDSCWGFIGDWETSGLMETAGCHKAL
jgi:hypothetical protein